MYQGAYEIVLPHNIRQSSVDTAVAILNIVKRECPQQFSILRGFAFRCWRGLDKREKRAILYRRMTEEISFWEDKINEVAGMETRNSAKWGRDGSLNGADADNYSLALSALSELQQNMEEKRESFKVLRGNLSPEDIQAADEVIDRLNSVIANKWAEEYNLQCFPIVSVIIFSLQKWLLDPANDDIVREVIEYDDLELPAPPVPELGGESMNKFLGRARAYRHEFMGALEKYVKSQGFTIEQVPGKKDIPGKDPERHYLWLVKHRVLKESYLDIASAYWEEGEGPDAASVRRAVQRVANQIGLPPISNTSA